MQRCDTYLPRHVPQVMVSSTFTDLKEHRAALIDAIHHHKMHANVMEHDDAKLADLIDSSLQMVRDSAAYILIISQKYGQIPECASRNPENLSITELEFNEAQRLERPILLFIMGESHPLTKSDLERDSTRERKLEAFRERAKMAAPEASVPRVYSVFNSLDEFKEKIHSPLSELAQLLNSAQATTNGDAPAPTQEADAIPKPPAFYASPDYIGRHHFIGRKAQLHTLSEWALPADQTSVLLFSAIGGNGKSMLAWEWTTRHANTVRTDWAGRFWYSFYEKGTIMREFCRHALAYMTQQPLSAYAKKNTPELRDELIAQLHARPWLLVLDGLERVLVAYHRIDAAEVRDEDLNQPTDKILDRNPCDAIRDEDTDLLRALAAAAPSKILVSSRLVPRAFLNPSGLPLPGVRPLELPGLDEADAEEMLRSCGIRGNSADIRYYLTTFCGNHPLVIGVLAGLINSPGPHRGNFDAWAADPEYGAKLDLASLDLVQRRNHILRAAIDALIPASRRLLSTLALVSNAVDYETVSAFNPHMPPEAPRKLAETVQDLEHRGLLQYDGRRQRYDLHPVVRGVAASGMAAEDQERYGQRVVDYYSSVRHDPYEKAKTIEDVENGLQVVRTLLKLGRHQDAADAYVDDLSNSLLFSLEAHAELLALLRPFFQGGWDHLPTDVEPLTASYLANDAAGALGNCGNYYQSIRVLEAALRSDLGSGYWIESHCKLSNIASGITAQNQLSKSARAVTLSLELARATDDAGRLFRDLLVLFGHQSLLGQWGLAEETWRVLEPMSRDWPRFLYRKGELEFEFALFQYYKGALDEKHLLVATTAAGQDDNRPTVRRLHGLRGAWRLEQSNWVMAGASFAQATAMARERRLVDGAAETGLALAKLHLGKLTGDEAFSEAERLAQRRFPAHRYLAMLWQAIGDLDRARQHALAAYKWAWADGEPYVRRFELTRTTELLQTLGTPVPKLPPYDPAQDQPFPWEADVRAAIEKLRAEKESREKVG